MPSQLNVLLSFCCHSARHVSPHVAVPTQFVPPVASRTGSQPWLCGTAAPSNAWRYQRTDAQACSPATPAEHACSCSLRLTSVTLITCAGGDTPADTHTPQQAQQQAQHPPKKPQGVALDACLRPLKGKWIDEGPITDAILPDVEDVVTPDFEDEPGFRGAVALTYGTTPWGQKVATSFRITFKNRYTADESKYIFHREDYTLRDDTGKSKAKMETRLYVTWYKEPSNPKGNSSSSSSGGGSPDPNLEIKEVEIRTRVDGPEGRALSDTGNSAYPMVMMPASGSLVNACVHAPYASHEQ